MENIRNYKTNCKVNLMKFYHFQDNDQRNNNQQKTEGERNEKLLVKLWLFTAFYFPDYNKI